ncbi:hypothetical protein Hanom_Chr14g01286011 [Helianthus anomalus]
MHKTQLKNKQHKSKISYKKVTHLLSLSLNSSSLSCSLSNSFSRSRSILE